MKKNTDKPRKFYVSLNNGLNLKYDEGSKVSCILYVIFVCMLIAPKL